MIVFLEIRTCVPDTLLRSCEAEWALSIAPHWRDLSLYPCHPVAMVIVLGFASTFPAFDPSGQLAGTSFLCASRFHFLPFDYGGPSLAKDRGKCI